MKLHFTSGYHPKGDGQTERMNQTLEQYLQVYCNYQQDNWLDLLPIAKFAYNNAPNTTTGISPFFANVLHQQRIPPQHHHAPWLRLNLIHSQTLCHRPQGTPYSASANRQRIPAPEFWVGDKVFVKSDHICTTRPLKKLSEKFLGPFTIITQAGTCWEFWEIWFRDFQSVNIQLCLNVCTIVSVSKQLRQ